jgi:SP family arabinose:H+ symporter-like MFS transporter
VNRSRKLAAMVCSLGGLIFGYDLGALSTAAPSLREAFHLSPLHFGLTIAASLWGTVGGSMIVGRTADRIGGPKLVSGCAALYLITAATLLFSSSLHWTLLLGVRFLSGAAIGGFTVGSPLYLAEMAPARLRGLFVGLFQFQIGVGVLLAFAVGAVGNHLITGPFYWRFCLGFGALPATLLLSIKRYMTPSPRWLANRNRWEDANRAANLLALSEIEWPRNQANNSAEFASQRHDRLFTKKYLSPLLLATSIALFNQLSGVNIILLYLFDLLSSAGFNALLSRHYAIVISGFNLAITVVSMQCVDRFGRKPLLLVGSLGMAICLFCLGESIPHHIQPIWYLILLVAYNGFFAFSQGTVVWIYLSELFPFGVRGRGQGYGATVHWIANAVLVLVFPLMKRTGPTQGFYLFAVMMILQMVVIVVWYPETKGKALGISD